MNILCYTGYDNVERYKRMGNISSLQKEDYARKHGYNFLCRRTYSGFDRHVSWFKIKEIIQLLPLYDYIWWSDADIQIKNPEIRLESFLTDVPVEFSVTSHEAIGQRTLLYEPSKEPSLIVSADEHGPCFASFLIKNTKWSIDFFSEIYEQTQYLNDPWWDQRAAHWLWFNKKYLDSLSILPATKMNSWSGNYKDGDFLLHGKF